jgi:zinc transport system ATP-binding protein
MSAPLADAHTATAMRAPAREAAPGAMLIAGHGLGYSVDGQRILDHVDIEIGAHEIVTLIGPNGAGKTTLIRLLLGLAEPDVGTITRRPGLRIGYMPQRFAPSPHLPITARRFLATARAAAGEDLAARLAEVGAETVADTQLNDLSGGELQRVLMARALLGNPDLLVLDEPVRSVDVTGQTELFDLIADIRRRRGCGMLIVSHELHIVMAATDRVICLNKHVCCAGRPESISADPSFIAMFGPAAARRLAVYTHEHDHAHDIAGSIVPEHGHDHAHSHDQAHAAGGTAPQRAADR